MGVVTITDGVALLAKEARLLCPVCNKGRLKVITAKHNKTVVITKIVCNSPSCKRRSRAVYDVANGFVRLKK